MNKQLAVRSPRNVRGYPHIVSIGTKHKQSKDIKTSYAKGVGRKTTRPQSYIHTPPHTHPHTHTHTHPKTEQTKTGN